MITVILDSWDSESVSAHVERAGKIIERLPEIAGEIADETDALYAAKCEAERLGYQIYSPAQSLARKSNAAQKKKFGKKYKDEMRRRAQVGWKK